MTKGDIIRMARDADHYANASHAQWRGHQTVDPEWTVCRDEHFAKLVAAAEREACAEICIDLVPDDYVEENGAIWWDFGWVDCAEAIRARGES